MGFLAKENSNLTDDALFTEDWSSKPFDASVSSHLSTVVQRPDSEMQQFTGTIVITLFPSPIRFRNTALLAVSPNTRQVAAAAASRIESLPALLGGNKERQSEHHFAANHFLTALIAVVSPWRLQPD